MRHDFWFAIRRIRLRPLHSAVIALTLGLGIGAALAVFAVVDAVLLRPLPYRDADRLVRITRTIPVPGLPEVAYSDVGYRRLVSDSRTLVSAAAYDTRDANLIGRGAPLRLTSARVTASFFDVLATQPVLGRAFTREEDVPNGPRVVVLADWLWRSSFGADPRVIGGAANLDGEPVTIVGVMSATAGFPTRAVGVWEPLRLDPAGVNPYNARYSVIGRLRPRATLDAARRDLTASVRAVGKEYPGPHAGSALDFSGFQARVKWLGDDVIGDARPVVALLLAGVLLLLVLTCANVANLQLAAASARGEELAVRAALGATRSRLVRGALIEGVILAAAGALVGLAAGSIGTRLLATLMPTGIALDTSLAGSRTLIAAAIIVLVIGAVVGALPVASTARRDAALALRDRASSGPSVTVAGVRRMLAAGQVAVAVLLLHGAGLLIASAHAVQEVALGFRPDSTLSLRINMPAEKFRNRAGRETFIRNLLAEVERVPGVSVAAIANALPLEPGRRDLAMALEGRPFRADGTDPLADYRVVSASYFETMGIRLVRGRIFRDDEAGPALTPLVISEGLAKEIWGDDTDPVGHRLRFGPNAPWMPIVGVVADAKNRSVTEGPRPELYTPALGSYSNLALASEFTLIARTEGSATSLVGPIRRIINELDPELPIYNVASVREVVRASRARMTTVTNVMVAYSVAALVLAVAGTYAVLSYLVAMRRREIAVRVALGATPAEVIGLVARESGLVVGSGAVVGLTSAAGLGRLLSGLLYGVGTFDAGVVMAVVAAAGLVGVASALIPAQRAARVDPCTVLRGTG
ncbi:MAG TPA: ADOP family duplicated permease [Gemmatimonadaceae bacterium]|nr:ADOP family duplicated permease [Gemmatimonadaceae bacterium]